MMVWDEAVAREITGCDADNNVMQLESDLLLYWRLGAVEQGAINRLALSDDTLWDEMYKTKGFVALGDGEELRTYLHDQIDQMFTAIYLNRGVVTPEQAHIIRQGTNCLDDFLYPEETNVEK